MLNVLFVFWVLVLPCKAPGLRSPLGRTLNPWDCLTKFGNVGMAVTNEALLQCSAGSQCLSADTPVCKVGAA